MTALLVQSNIFKFVSSDVPLRKMTFKSLELS